TRSSVAAESPLLHPFPIRVSMHTTKGLCCHTNVSEGCYFMRQAVARGSAARGPHIPVLGVPETLARIVDRRDLQTLHLLSLRVQVVAEVQEHYRHLGRECLEDRGVELAPFRLIRRAARGLEAAV